MAEAGELLRGITYRNEAAQQYAGALVLDVELGYLRFPDTQGISLIKLVGFGNLLQRNNGEVTNGDYVVAVTQYEDLADIEKDPNKLLKAGVADRIYNTGHALGNTLEDPEEADVWAIDIRAGKLRDERKEGDARLTGKIGRVLHHATLLRQVSKTGLEATTAELHEKFQTADAVLFNEPPHADIRQLIRGNANPTSLFPKFIAIRSQAVRMRRLGKWHKPQNSTV